MYNGCASPERLIGKPTIIDEKLRKHSTPARLQPPLQMKLLVRLASLESHLLEFSMSTKEKNRSKENKKKVRRRRFALKFIW
jgi:hypothetical protein